MGANGRAQRYTESVLVRVTKPMLAEIIARADANERSVAGEARMLLQAGLGLLADKGGNDGK